LNNAGLIEFVVVFGIVLGLACYDLISLRREKPPFDGDDDDDDDDRD
jgi:hypothetical protein